MPFAGQLKNMAKLAVGLGIAALLGYALYAGVTSIYRDVEEMDPHPTDPTETASEFFYSLWDRNYQGCYSLLSSQRKTATIIGKQDRLTGYEPHFERIRNYLSAKAGADFDEVMKVVPGGQEVTFGDNVALTVTFAVSKDYNNKDHYGIAQINEFPIDVAPEIGLEAHNRRIDRALGATDGIVQAEESDDPAEILQDRQGESQQERQVRVIQAFRDARQLDTREALLKWIVRESGRQTVAQQILNEIVNDKNEPPQMRLIAREALGR